MQVGGWFARGGVRIGAGIASAKARNIPESGIRHCLVEVVSFIESWKCLVSKSIFIDPC